ncbi:hypothetical protein B0H14DRAFT_2573752 [Mycena olivaceomarginata]|nr:hypothetical protein B0H14DRAFT_2573752 [Mycena olivaceomarginata]
MIVANVKLNVGIESTTVPACMEATPDEVQPPSGGEILMWLWPLAHVVKDALGLVIADKDLPASGDFCVSPSTVQAGEDGALRGCGDEENIWAYNNNRVLWSAGNLAEILD